MGRNGGDPCESIGMESASPPHDSAYNNVILHVVHENDEEVFHRMVLLYLLSG